MKTKKANAILLALMILLALFATAAAPVKTAQPDAKKTVFRMFKDDSAVLKDDRYAQIAYMGIGDKNGNDGSIAFNAHDKSQFSAGKESMMFSYTPISSTHWSGAALLWKIDDWSYNPGAKGPDLKKFTELRFQVKGSGGKIKFFAEGDDKSQITKFVTLKDEWQEISLTIDKDWKYVTVPFGWACNQSDPDTRGGTITFYIDVLQFV